MAEPLKGTECSAKAITRVTYSHDVMIDYILGNPMASQTEVAKHFGYGVAWVNRVMNSDAFLARLAVRKAELVDPGLAASIDEKLRTVVSTGLDVIIDKIQTLKSFEHSIKAVELASKALGYGTKKEVAVQNNFVVALPSKAQSAEEWMAAQRERVVNPQ